MSTDDSVFLAAGQPLGEVGAPAFPPRTSLDLDDVDTWRP